MIRRIFLSVAVLVLAGCTSIEKLSPPLRASHFVLREDHVRVQVRGIASYQWIEGLRAGTYTAVGEDTRGTFYLGEGDSVIVLSQERGARYLSRKEIPAPEERAAAQNGMAGGRGGLWLPKPGVQEEPKLFYELHVSQSTLSAPSTGVIGLVGAHLAEGALQFVPYGSERDFTARLTIVSP
jgi:hypothetical protein